MKLNFSSTWALLLFANRIKLHVHQIVSVIIVNITLRHTDFFFCCLLIVCVKRNCGRGAMGWLKAFCVWLIRQAGAFCGERVSNAVLKQALKFYLPKPPEFQLSSNLPHFPLSIWIVAHITRRYPSEAVRRAHNRRLILTFQSRFVCSEWKEKLEWRLNRRISRTTDNCAVGGCN